MLPFDTMIFRTRLNVINTPYSTLCRTVITILVCLFTLHPAHTLALTTDSPIPFGIAATPPASGNNYESILQVSRATGIVALPGLWYNVFNGEGNSCPGMAPLIKFAQYLNMQVVVRFEAFVLGTPAVPLELGESSFGNPAVVNAYLDQMACFASLHVDYLVLGPEINFAYRLNRPEFDLYADAYKQAYNLVKAISPQTKIGVSYQYLSMLSYDEWEAVDLIGPQDYVGFTKYFGITLDRYMVYPDPSIVPDNFFQPIRTHFPDRPIVFTEYAWSSYFSNEGEYHQARLLLQTPRLMKPVQPELVMWASLHDLEDFTNANILQATDLVGLWSKNVSSIPKPAWYFLQKMFENGFFVPSVTPPLAP